MGKTMDAKIPVIFDTDIGTDIDDTWALAYLLKSPELDVRLITTTTGDTWNRAKIVARFLELAGRTDIPIGVGLPLESSPNYQENWTVDYDLDKYPGTILENGVQALVQTIRDAGEQVSLIEAGPFPNTAAALISDPELIQSSRVVGMFGSVYRGYFGDPGCTLTPAEGFWNLPGILSWRPWIPVVLFRSLGSVISRF